MKLNIKLRQPTLFESQIFLAISQLLLFATLMLKNLGYL